MDRVSIIIPIKDALSYFKKCIYSIKKYTTDYELIVIDNDSNKETKKYLKRLNATVHTNSENKGFSYASNQGIKLASCDWLCFLNSDTFVTTGWIRKLKKCFYINTDCGIASPTTCFSSGSQCDRNLLDKRHKMSEADILNYASTLDEGYQATLIYGFCMLTKKSILSRVGAFDYKCYGIGNFEEIDLQWRLKKVGYKSYWVKGAYVHHWGHKTFDIVGDNNLSKNKTIFEKRKRNGNIFIENDVEI